MPLTAEEKNDITQIIKDELPAALATRAVGALEKANEDVRHAELTGRDILRELRDAMNSKRRSPESEERGLNFARVLKAGYVAHTAKRQAKDVAHEWGKTQRHYKSVADLIDAHQRSMSESVAAAGGSLVPSPAMGEFIEYLNARTLAFEMGARSLDFTRALELGKQNGTTTAYYLDEMANIIPSQPATGKLALTSHKAAALVNVSNDLLRNPSVGADALVRDDLLNVMRLRRDLSFFRGLGTTGQPKGMRYWADSGNIDSQGGTTVADKVADTVQMIRFVDESNVGLESAAYVMAPRTRWALASTYDNATGLVFASMLKDSMLWGFPVGSSTQIPRNLGGGGNESEIHFGAFNDAILGMDDTTPREVEMFANGTYHDGTNIVSGISQDSTVFRIIEGHDVVLRHSKAWAVLTNVTWA